MTSLNAAMKFYVLSLVLLFVIRLRFPKSKSIADIVTHRYGQSVLKSIRKYERTDYKISKIKLDTEFLENCIKNNLIPTFVKFKVANHRLKNSKTYKDCQIRLLHEEVHNKRKQLNIQIKKLKQLNAEIRSNISWIDFAHIAGYFTAHNEKMLTKVRLIHEKKLVMLGFREAGDTNDPEKVIINSRKVIINERT